jgi:gliding motility-associated-like protein
MKRILLSIFIFFMLSSSFAQPITVNTNTYTVPQLVRDVLFNNGSSGSGSSCVGTISNITWSTGNTHDTVNGVNGIGYFTNTNPNFPLTNGVVLSTGSALAARGPNTFEQSNGSFDWPGDNQLFNYMQSLGIVNSGPPAFNQMSFDFLFASEEYGEWQCGFSDAFAFFLTNVTAGTTPVNLALVPNTNIPISVTTIRDNSQLPICGAANQMYFGSNNQGAAAGSSPTNFNGQTKLMTATSNVVPGNTYHIKLVIADLDDHRFDSAVFLGGGSFSIGTPDLTGTGIYAGLNDLSIANGLGVCNSIPITIQAGAIAVPGVTYEWTVDNDIILGANTNSYTITEGGVYGITITYPGGCQQTDSMNVEYYPPLILGEPNDLVQCSAPYDLTQNQSLILNGLSAPIEYYRSLADAQTENNPITNLTNYPGVNNEEIFVAVLDQDTFCFTITSFLLIEDNSLCIPPVIVGNPLNLAKCEDGVGSGVADFDFTSQTALALGSNNAADYTVTYHMSQIDADNGTGDISPIDSFQSTNVQTIFVRVEENLDPTRYGVTTFTITVNAIPTATISGTTTVCEGDVAAITFTGTPGADVTYLINPGATVSTIALATTGSATITQPFTSNTTYTLISVETPSTGCSQLIGGLAAVTVNPLPTATISGTTTVCQGATSPVVTFTGANGTAPYTFTYLDENGATRTITTTSGNSATLTVPTTTPRVYTYQLVSVSSAGIPTCSQAQSGLVTVTVNALPTATISAGATVCLNSPEPQIVLTGANGTAPYTFTYSLNSAVQSPVTTTGGNTHIINAPTNVSGTFVYELISVSDSSSPSCSQSVTGTATVVVNQAPTINNPTPYVVCDDSFDNEGFACFNLSTKINQITGGNPNIVVEFYETSTSGVALPMAYCNIEPFSQTLYVRAYFTGSPACFSTTTLQLQVNPLPLANPVIDDYELCDYNSPGDEQEIFTLNSKSVEIANGQTGVTVSYYATQQDAIDRTNALPNSYPNGSNPQQIWINIRNNATGCNTVSSFNLVVNPLPLAVTPLPIFECSNGAVTTAEFDLTVNENVITGGVPGMLVSYYHTLAEAQTPSSPITPPTAYMGNDGETIYVRVENIQTGCYSTTTQLLRVTQGPVAVTPQPLHYCDPNNDGFGVFDLESATNEIAGGSLPLGVTVTYHETETDALLGSNALSSPYPNIVPNQQTIYVKVFYTTTGCSNYVELELIVDPTPEATVPSAYHLCDYTGAVGFESFNLLSYIPQILGGINPLTHTVTFYTSLPQAELGTGFIATPGNYTNGTINQETIYVRVENNTTGCYDIVTLDLIVDPLPLSQQPSYLPYNKCDYDRSRIGYEVFDLNSRVALILDGQTGMRVTFYPSLLDAQNNSNAITNLNYENTIIYVQTLGIRITNETTGCYVTSTMDIRVEPLPEPIPPTSPYTICDDNQDGFSEFDLSTLVNDILGGATYLLSFHETLTNAETNDYALPMLYTNIHPFVQIIYLRAENPDTHCVSIIPIELNVNPSPVAPISLAPIEVCDTDANDQDGSTLVNLTVRTSDVLAQQPLPASSYVVTYYTNPTDAGLENNPIVNVLSHPGSNGDTIWVRVENIATGCYNLGSFELIIGIPLIVPIPQSINQCDTAPNDQYAVFDLTVRTITTLPGYTIQYYPSLTKAQNDLEEITNITSYTNVDPAVQTLGVKITSPQGCVSYTTLNIRVLPVPTPNTNPQVLPAVCENAPNSGQATVDLTQNQAYIINGDPNVTLHYFPTLTDLENNTNEITNPSSALVGDTTLTDDPIGLVQYVYIAVSSNNNIDYSGRNCYTVVPQGYIINPLPIVDIIGTTNVYQICESDPTGNDNIEVFDLTSQIPDLLEGNVTTPTSNYSVAFYDASGLITNPSAYTNTSNPQTISVIITNTTTGCVSQSGQFDIQVNPKPIIAVALSDLDFTTCDDQDGVNDGQALHQYDPLSLSGSVAQILGATQLPTDYDVTFYYNSQANAEAGINSVDATAAVQTGTYWVRVEDKATGCYITGSFSVVVEQLAEPNVVANTTIACVDFGDTVVNNTLILDSQVTGNYTFEWYADGVLIPGAISSTLTVTEMTQDEVEFSVIAISNAPGLGCRSDDVPQRTKITITRSGVASNVSYTVSNAFSDLQTITITYDGYGEYHFSLDDGPILDNGGVFTDVPMGEHTVHVWDMRDPNYSCGVVSISGVQVIDYPHYFTPNGDGIHDTWNIKGLKNFADDTKIYIFDRYGKLLKQISSAGDGWDGTFNGQLMPSSDYWFRVEYPEQGVMKEFKAHFSLKR